MIQRLFPFILLFKISIMNRGALKKITFLKSFQNSHKNIEKIFFL